MWDPKSQTYKGGIVPSHHTAMDIDELLNLNNDGKLKIFGYGSLCWHPGSEGVLSLANIEEDEHEHDVDIDVGTDTDNANNASASANKPKRKVTTAPGRAIGYQRCWSQRSADHRGTTEFNGIVCTLLSDEEVWKLHHDDDDDAKHDDDAMQQQQKRPRSMTEGLIYTVDVDLVDECLAELDFREKGGYARDVIDVVEDDTGETVKALLYRGTPDNPAFWKRALLDLPLAAAIISVAIGPSGPNDIYLLHLHQFLTHAAEHSAPAAHALEDHSGDFHTGELASMVKLLQTKDQPYFLFGAGSNEHNQLLLNSSTGSSASDIGADVNEVHDLSEMLLVVPQHPNDDEDGQLPKSLHAGGGHSALLTKDGSLYLWGWNDAGQLGRVSTSSEWTDEASHLNPIQPLTNINVETANLGHTHTLVIEKETGRLFAFGENGRGQVSGSASAGSGDSPSHNPQTPIGLSEETFVDVAAGLFHSAAITKQGELITWGCGRFGQCLEQTAETQTDGAASTMGRWKPADGSCVVQVACGRRHTVVLDDHGRIWTLGDNKYGQLGRSVDSTKLLKEPQLVEGPLGEADSGCFAICSGWSHILALTLDRETKAVSLYGWGRNDRGQLGMQSSTDYITCPQLIKPLQDADKEQIGIKTACCGSESSHLIDTEGQIYSTGWNEHGNLAIGPSSGIEKTENCLSWTTSSGARVVAPPPTKIKGKIFAAGGAHFITIPSNV